jgi:ABC-type branched-subunit amino acid transport system substrate-binding protein
LILLAVAALFTTTACGQKGGVHVAATSNGGGLAAATPGAGGASGTGTDQGAAGSGQALTPGAPGAPGATGSATGPAAGPTAAPGGAGGSAGPTAGGPVSGGNSTGVTDNSILVGIHAPLTGAGLPAPQFVTGKDVYFNFINKTGGINGRQVKVVVEDDGYNPSQAVAACKKMVEQDHVFLLVGAAGTDQIVACAQYAASVGVPYVAEGVTEQGLGNLSNYFAESMTYPAQGLLLASYIKSVIQKTKVVMVRADTDNFNDAQTAFQRGASADGLNVTVIKVSKDGSDALSVASQMCQAGGLGGSFVVYPLMAPAVFIRLVNAAAGQACFPRYAGIGNTLGINEVLAGTCASQSLRNGASFFTTYPGLDKINSIDPNYNTAYNAQNRQNGDDLGLAIWAVEKLLAAQIAGAGKNLSRQSFLAAVAGKKFSTGVAPDVDYSKSRFGGTAMHVLLANCTTQRYDTQYTFKSSFP